MSNRACVLTSVHEPFDVRIFHRECRSLAQAGYDVTLIAPHLRDEFVEGVRIQAVPLAPGRLSRMTRTVWRIYRRAKRQGADVYHFHDPELIPVALLLRAQGKKVVYDIHEDLPRTVCRKYYLPAWSRRPLAWLLEWVENFSSRWFSALLPTTPSLAERFEPLNQNTIVIYNYPRLKDLTPQTSRTWDQRCSAVAYVGSTVSVVRGIRQMVEAMAMLPDRLNATLHLAGVFEPPSVKEEITRLEGWKRVRVWGVVDYTRVPEILGRVRAGLVLEHHSSHVTALPIKLFEYMCAGIPVVASDFPLWRQIVQEAGCGILVDPFDCEAIAKAIEYLLVNPETAEEMGRRGRTAIERYYNWGNEEQKLLRVYSHLSS